MHYRIKGKHGETIKHGQKRIDREKQGGGNSRWLRYTPYSSNKNARVPVLFMSYTKLFKTQTGSGVEKHSCHFENKYIIKYTNIHHYYSSISITFL